MRFCSLPSLPPILHTHLNVMLSSVSALFEVCKSREIPLSARQCPKKATNVSWQCAVLYNSFVALDAAHTSLQFALNACSGSVMQAPLKRSQQTALNFQPLKKIRTQTEPDPEPMEAPKPVRPANAQPVRKLVIKNLKGNFNYIR
jgi:hypothetical protein